MALPQPRADLGLREGYHSPQVEVPSGSTPTSRRCRRPRSGWPHSARPLPDLDFNRYPDRARHGAARRPWPTCTACGRSRSSAPTGPTRCCRALPGLRRGGAFGGHLRADLCPALPTSPISPGPRSSKRVGGPTSRSTSTSWRTCCAAISPAITFLCSPNNPTGMAESRTTVEAVLAAVARLGGRGRGLRAVRRLVGARDGRRRRAARGHPDLLQDLVDGGRPPRVPDRPGAGGCQPGAGRPAIPPRCDQAGGRPAGGAVRGPDGGPRRAAGQRTPPNRDDARPTCRSRRGRRRPTSCCFAPRPARGPRCGRSCSTAPSWSGTLPRGRGWRAACGSPWVPRRKTTPFWTRWPRC